MSELRTFTATKEELEIYNGQAVINNVFEILNEDATAFGFTGESGLFITFFNEREGVVVKEFTDLTGLSRNSNNIFWNANPTDMQFDDRGKYYYELGFIRSGGYEQVLCYGNAKVI